MNPDPLERNLAAYSQQPQPPCPQLLADDVWREVERRGRQSFWARILPLLEWREIFAEPRIAVPALACAFAIGVLPITLRAKSHTEQRLARQSIHLTAFSANAVKQLTSLAPAAASDKTQP